MKKVLFICFSIIAGVATFYTLFMTPIFFHIANGDSKMMSLSYGYLIALTISSFLFYLSLRLLLKMNTQT